MLWIDKLNIGIGKGISWLTLLLVLFIIVDVLLRYVFNITSVASFELEWHLFALIFLLGTPWTLQEDRHVRVDVFYNRFSAQTQAWINLLGTFFLLFPLCSITFWESLSFVASSYRLNETSAQPGGLPYRWALKAVIPLSFLLLGLQGVSIFFKSLKELKND